MLPSTTILNKRIPKQKFYDNLSITPKIKRIFIDNIKSIIWANKIAPSTMNIKSGEIVTELEVFKIILNSDSNIESVIKQIDSQIPYHILFILEYSGKQQIWIGYKEYSSDKKSFSVIKYYQTEWLEENAVDIQLDGLNMDEIYYNLVRDIGGFEKDNTKNLKDQIADDDRRKQLEKEIARLEKQAWAEKQPKKKFELAGKVKKLKDELKQISANNNGGKTNG